MSTPPPGELRDSTPKVVASRRRVSHEGRESRRGDGWGRADVGALMRRVHIRPACCGSGRWCRSSQPRPRRRGAERRCLPAARRRRRRRRARMLGGRGLPGRKWLPSSRSFGGTRHRRRSFSLFVRTNKEFSTRLPPSPRSAPGVGSPSGEAAPPPPPPPPPPNKGAPPRPSPRTNRTRDGTSGEAARRGRGVGGSTAVSAAREELRLLDAFEARMPAVTLQ